MKIEQLIHKISEKNPMHGNKVQRNYDLLKDKETFLADFDHFMAKYEQILEKKQLTIDNAVDFYLKMIDDFAAEFFDFMRSGSYKNSSFEAVDKALYDNPSTMVSHMHGLLLSQFLWKHHYEVYEFFKANITKYQPIHSYLEIGAGHGLYLEAAIQQLGADTNFEALDISATSIELTQSLVKNKDIVYHHQDIFDLNNAEPKDFITMGEVLEHVENPLALLQKLKSMLQTNGTIFITTPTNAPSIDHIYLFRNVGEIRSLINEAGLEIAEEKYFVSEEMDLERAEKMKIAVLYAAFLKIKN